MKTIISNIILGIFALLTLVLVWAGVGYSFDFLPLKYCVIYGILWQVNLFITILWEDSWK